MWVRRLVSPESDRSALATHPIVIDRRRQFEGRDPGDKDVAVVVVDRRAGRALLQAVVAGQDDGVHGLVVSGDGVVAAVHVVEHEGVSARSAVHPIVAFATVQPVVSSTAGEDIVAGVTGQVVVALFAEQAIIARPAKDEVEPVATPDHVASFVAHQVVIAVGALDEVIAFAARREQGVVAPAAQVVAGHDDIRATAAVHLVLAGTGQDQVGAFAA